MMFALDSPEERARMTEYFISASKRLYNIALGILKNEMDAQDAVQLTLEKFMAQFQSHEIKTDYSKKRITAFLCVVAKNTSLDMLRARKRHGLVCLPDEEEKTAPEIRKALEIPGFEADLLDHLMLQAAIESLPDRDQILLQAYHVLGRKRSEAAALAGYTENGAKSRLTKIYAVLRRAVETEAVQ